MVKLNVFLEKYGEKEILTAACGQKGEAISYAYVTEKNDWIDGKLLIEKDKDFSDIYILSANLRCKPYPYDYMRMFQKATAFSVEFPIAVKKGTAIRKYNPFWTEPVFIDSQKDADIAQNCLQHILFQKDETEYIYCLPVCGSYGLTDMEYVSESRSLKFVFHPSDCADTVEDVPMAVIASSKDPYKAIENAYQTAWNRGLIQTPPRKQKSYPEKLEGLGWCTWNAFYHDVTAEKIIEKLKEFREKKIPIEWILIDDGWSLTQDFKLVSLLEDKEKFPEGLNGVIKEIKEVYGIKYVGVWHTLTGYWFGMDETFDVSCIGESYKLCAAFTNVLLPAADCEGAFAYFDTWHSYLRKQGVDFVKVDAQGNALEFLQHQPGAYKQVMALHSGLERSIKKNFENCMINCMGLGSLDMFSRQYSSVVRNSDDFFPDKENGFLSHVMQNTYNGVFHAPLYYCDFDMWWSKHFSAKQSSILRAVSGGPIYVSDKIGESEPEYILPLVDEEGKMIRCDDTARPTRDCLLSDPSHGVLKLYNHIGNHYVVAAFNLTDEEQTVSLGLEELDGFVGADGAEYTAYLHYGQAVMEMENNRLTFALKARDAEILNIFEKGALPAMGRLREQYIAIS